MDSRMIAILTRRFLQCGSAIQNRTLLTNATTSTRTFRSFSTLESIKSLKNEGRFLLTKLQSTLRKEFRRNGSDKRPAKKWKEIKFSDLKQIFPLIYPWKISRRILGGIALLFLSSSIFLSLPRILGKLIDSMDETKTQNEKEDVLTKAAKFFKNNLIALAAVVLVAAFALGGRIYCMHTASQLVVNDLRTNVFKSILRQDMAFFDKNKVGEIISRLSSDAFVVGYSISSNLSEGLRGVFQCIGSVGMMYYTSPDLTLLGVFVIPVIGGTFYVFGKLQTKYTIQMQEALAGTNQLATERLSNVRTVRAFVAEMKELEAYKRKISEIWTVSRMEGTAKAIMSGGFQLVIYGYITSMLCYGSYLISQGLLTYGDLSAFMIYAILASASFMNMQNFYTELMKGLGASQRLFELRDLKPNIPLTGGIVLNDLKKEIRFESVAFSYPDRDPIFNDVTFRVPVASTTAIVGPSGCGKSTIAHLILRLYTPTLGRIVVDDHDLRELDPSAWRRLIGTVSQEPVLFSATIKQNILYGMEEGRTVTDEELHEAAKLSNCLEFIQKFPDGFDTMVGEHGASMLSGGQRQRIAIARALITKPRILIFDEATSALDATSEYFVRNALDTLLAKSGQTVLIIAHRLSTIKYANQIIVLDKGTVAERGNFNELMAIKDGIFHKLVEKQTFDWRDDNY